MAGPDDQQDLGGQDKESDYKLVVLRADDLHEVRSVQLSLSNIYVIISAVLLLLSAGIFSLLAFTPLKRLIPGYGKIESNEEFLRLVDGVDELTKHAEAQDLYMNAIRNLIVPTTDSTPVVAELPLLTTNTAPVTTKVPTTSPIVSGISSVSPRSSSRQALNENVSSDLWDVISSSSLQAPVEGVVSSVYDPSIKHFGVDILAPAKSPIRAIMDGYVISSGWDLETGYTLGVQHEGQILSFYKHNSHLLKEKGTFVKAGEAVAIIGNTGTLSSGPHLHFELWHNGKPINPTDILNFK